MVLPSQGESERQKLNTLEEKIIHSAVNKFQITELYKIKFKKKIL